MGVICEKALVHGSSFWPLVSPNVSGQGLLVASFPSKAVGQGASSEAAVSGKTVSGQAESVKSAPPLAVAAGMFW